MFSLASQLSVSNGFHIQIAYAFIFLLLTSSSHGWNAQFGPGHHKYHKRRAFHGCRNYEHFDYKVGLKYINHYIPAFNTNILIQTISSVLSLSIAAVTGAVSCVKIAPIGNWVHFFPSRSTSSFHSSVSWNANLQLLSRPHIFEKYFITHDRTLVLKY